MSPVPGWRGQDGVPLTVHAGAIDVWQQSSHRKYSTAKDWDRPMIRAVRQPHFGHTSRSREVFSAGVGRRGGSGPGNM
jgi:hypothetical protein